MLDLKPFTLREFWAADLRVTYRWTTWGGGVRLCVTIRTLKRPGSCRFSRQLNPWRNSGRCYCKLLKRWKLLQLQRSTRSPRGNGWRWVSVWKFRANLQGSWGSVVGHPIWEQRVTGLIPHYACDVVSLSETAAPHVMALLMKSGKSSSSSWLTRVLHGFPDEDTWVPAAGHWSVAPGPPAAAELFEQLD